MFLFGLYYGCLSSVERRLVTKQFRSISQISDHNWTYMAFVSVFKVSIFNCTLFTPNTCARIYSESIHICNCKLRFQQSVAFNRKIAQLIHLISCVGLAVGWLVVWLVRWLKRIQLHQMNIESWKVRERRFFIDENVFFFQIHACRNPIHYNWCCRWNHSSPNNINDDIA